MRKLKPGMKRNPMRIRLLATALLLGVSLLTPMPPLWADTTRRLPSGTDERRVLRDYLATLRAADLDVESLPFLVPDDPTEDERFAIGALTLDLTQVGSVISSVHLSSEDFLLDRIESPEGIRIPRVEPLSAAWLATWNHPSNPYFGNRALLLRAWVYCIVDALMLDDAHERGEDRSISRSDYAGGTLIWLAGILDPGRDAVPPEVAAAYTTVVKRIADRIFAWGPTGAMTDMDLFAPVGLFLLGRGATNLDDEWMDRARAYSKRLFTEPRFFHPAGYFVDNGCFDSSYNGISLYFATWSALLSGAEWPFVTAALHKAYDLKTHLMFPEPDGHCFGPSHMSGRTSGCPAHDQWSWPNRDLAASYVADEALCLASPLPSDSAGRFEKWIASINRLVNQSSMRSPPQAAPWKERHWSRGLPFQVAFRPESYLKTTEKRSQDADPLLLLPHRRPGRFARAFDTAFMVVKTEAYSMAVHTGPLGKEQGTGGAPHGYGGSTISAFATPSAGILFLGRRRGGQGITPDIRDHPGNWSEIPVHGVCGVLRDGRQTTSRRLRGQSVDYATGVDPLAVVRVGHELPGTKTRYRRSYTMRPGDVEVSLQLEPGPQESYAELVEILPVWMGEGRMQRTIAATRIIAEGAEGGTSDLSSGSAWTGDVLKIRLERFSGAVEVVFDRPRRIQVAESEWLDGYQSRARARNILIDLLEPDPAARSFGLAYRIVPMKSESQPPDPNGREPVAE